MPSKHTAIYLKPNYIFILCLVVCLCIYMALAFSTFSFHLYHGSFNKVCFALLSPSLIRLCAHSSYVEFIMLLIWSVHLIHLCGTHILFFRRCICLRTMLFSFFSFLFASTSSFLVPSFSRVFVFRDHTNDSIFCEERGKPCNLWYFVSNLNCYFIDKFWWFDITV